MSRSVGPVVLDIDSSNQFVWFVRQSLRMTRPDGRTVLSAQGAGRQPSTLMRAALDLTNDAEGQVIAGHVIPERDRPDITPPRRDPRLSVHSEWAEAAILRCDWSAGAPQLALAYGNQSIRCELNTSRKTVWSGNWDPVVTVNGKKLRHDDRWDEVCWVSDEDGDYLELQINFAGDRVLQRQMFLARQDRFLFVADALLGSVNEEIAYESVLPLGPDAAFEPAEESREGSLCVRRRVGRVMPLSLPEWRVQSGPGELEATDSGLRLRLRHKGQRLFAPLFFDLNPARTQRQLTWRKLTIAQHLEIQPDDVAVGYRVQAGDCQWLIYRSLAQRGNRTLLGQNLSSEFVLARFRHDGEIEKLVEIE